MPELPEVETTVNGIKPWLENKTIQKINVHNPSLRWKIPEHMSKDYTSHTISSITRRAKYILIHLDDLTSDVSMTTTLILHLGMSGSLSIVSKDKELAKHDHFELITNDGTTLRLNDPRRFGCVLDSDDYEQHKLIKNLGPEPLDQTFTGAYLKKLSQNKTQSVKNFIMDGKIVVGVGNIYASESLFYAGINPKRSAKSISLTRYDTLAKVIRKVLSQAIEAGGTTLKDFVNADGKPGYFSQKLAVYGRKKLPCHICSSEIKQVVIGQRSTFYCTKCQK